MSSNPAVHASLLTNSSAVRPADRRCQVSISDISVIDQPGSMMMTPIIRKLAASDAEAFHTLRLEGLLSHPCEFGTAYEEEVDQPLPDIENRLEQGQIYGVFLGDKLAAIAGFRRFEQIKKRHKGELFGVYVQKEARGQKLGEAIVRQVINVAGTEVEQLLATVASLNHPAKGLYAKLGFETFGHEPCGLKVGDRAYDQDHLVLSLT